MQQRPRACKRRILGIVRRIDDPDLQQTTRRCNARKIGQLLWVFIVERQAEDMFDLAKNGKQRWQRCEGGELGMASEVFLEHGNSGSE